VEITVKTLSFEQIMADTGCYRCLTGDDNGVIIVVAWNTDDGKNRALVCGHGYTSTIMTSLEELKKLDSGWFGCEFERIGNDLQEFFNNEN